MVYWTAWVCAVSALWLAGGGSAQELWASVVARYSVDSTALVAESARRDVDVGYKLTGELAVAPLWRDPDHPHHMLLHFQLDGMSVWARGAARHAEWSRRESAWRHYGGGGWAARFRSGRLEELYLPLHQQHTHDFNNYERAITSLFQLESWGAEGERNETDVSGECRVLYEPLGPRVMRKIKRACVWEGVASASGGDRGAAVSARRVLRAEGGAAGLASLTAEEEWRAEAGAGGAAVRARAWHRLVRLDAPPPPRSAAHAQWRDALDALGADLRVTTLPMQLPDDFTHEPQESVAAAVSGSRAELAWAGAGAGGTAASAAAAARVLRAMRAASELDVLRVLQDPDNHDIIDSLWSLAGASGGGGAAAAATSLLQLCAAGSPPPAAAAFLAAAQSAHAQEGVIEDLLKISSNKQCSRESRWLALRAAGGAARGASPRVRRQVEQRLMKEARALKESDGEGWAAWSGAAAAARCAACVPALLSLLSRAPPAPAPRLAALHALAAMPPEQCLQPDVRRVLYRVSLSLDVPDTIEVRGAALQLYVWSLAHEAALHGTALLGAELDALHAALLRHGPHELRRAALLLLDARGDMPAVRNHVRRLKQENPSLYNYYLPGTSSVLEREIASWGGWAVRVSSLQAAAGGVLRAGSVRVHAVRGADSVPLAALHVRTQGMHALAPAPANAHGEDSSWMEAEEEMSAWLWWEGGGAVTGAVQLFAGQGGLAAAVWSGAGSAPTPVLRHVLPAPPAPRAHSVHPSAHGTPLAVHIDAAAQVSLDAQCAVSLWSRAGSGGAAWRGGGAAAVALSLRAAWASARAAARAGAQADLHIHSAIDFYEQVQLCVHATLPEQHYTVNVTLESVVGARRHSVRREHSRVIRHEPRSLSLGADNDRTCRDMHAAADL